MSTKSLSPYSTGNEVRVGHLTHMKFTHKKRNVHGQHKKFAFGTQCNLYSTGSYWGFCISSRENFASPNARETNMLVFFALGNAKVLSFTLGDAKIPNVNGFASQWNIGFKLRPPFNTISLNSLS